MASTFKVERKQLIKGLAYALDLAENRYSSHSQHITYLTLLLGKALNFPPDDLDMIFFASMLHDIGADLRYDLKSHSERGYEMIANLPVDSRIRDIILHHHETIDGQGPLGSKDNNVPLYSQLIHISNLFDYKFEIKPKSGKLSNDDVLIWLNDVGNLFSNDVVSAFEKIIRDSPLLEQYHEVPFYPILEKTYSPNEYFYEMEDIMKFATVFAMIIDNRSEFTHRHSQGVAKLYNEVAQVMNFDDLTMDKMHIAALLHDIGKLGVSNEIIDKPGKLTSDERVEIENHAMATYRILNEIQGFEDIATWASEHHEKLNQKGYPNKINPLKLSIQSRLLAIIDIYQALTEDRPYRNGMANERAFEIIEEMIFKGELDEILFQEVKVVLQDSD